jgi:hypothetical protein
MVGGLGGDGVPDPAHTPHLNPEGSQEWEVGTVDGDDDGKLSHAAGLKQSEDEDHVCGVEAEMGLSHILTPDAIGVSVLTVRRQRDVDASPPYLSVLFLCLHRTCTDASSLTGTLPLVHGAAAQDRQAYRQIQPEAGYAVGSPHCLNRPANYRPQPTSSR